MRVSLLVAPALAVAATAIAARPAAAPRVPGAPGCPIFPASNAWNQRVDKLPVARRQRHAHRRRSGRATGLHPDFGSIYGIPYQVVGSSTPRSRVTFDYADESDRGPLPDPVATRRAGERLGPRTS